MAGPVPEPNDGDFQGGIPPVRFRFPGNAHGGSITPALPSRMDFTRRAEKVNDSHGGKIAGTSGMVVVFGRKGW